MELVGKMPVDVLAMIDRSGNIRPYRVRFEDGFRCSIDAVLDVQRGVSKKNGAAGILYKVRSGRVTFILAKERRFDPKLKEEIDLWYAMKEC